MEKSNKFSLLGPFSIACVWFGTHVGPGFAGGAQLVSYFVKWGWVGVFLGPIAVSLISVWLIYYVMEFSRLYEAYNYRVFYDKAYGKFSIIFSNIKEILLFISCFVISAMIYATAGSLLNSLLGWPLFVGGILVLAIIVLFTMFGESVVRKSSTVISVLMIALILYIAFKAIGPSWGGMTEYVGNKTMYSDYPTAWINMLVYLTMFCSFIDAGMATSKGIVKTPKDSMAVAIMGSVMIGGCIILINMIFAAGMPEIQSEPLPTLWVLQNIMGAGFGIKLLYTVLALLALISTGVGFLYGAVTRYELSLSHYWKNSTANIRRAVILVVLLGASIAFGQFGILTVITYGYVYMSYLNLPLLFLPLLVILPIWVKKSKKKAALSESSETHA